MSEYVSVNEVAKHFNVSTSTVRIWMTSGLIPRASFIRVGRTYRFRLGMIEEFLLNQELPTKDDSEEVEEVEDAEEAEESPQIEMDFGDDDDADDEDDQ